MDKDKSKLGLYILIAQTIILSIGVFVAYFELKNIKIVNSGNLALELYKDIRSDRIFKANPKIIDAITNNKKILKENGGTIGEEDLDNYLGLFDWLAAANNSGILSNDMVYNFHGDLILNTYKNPEIKNYITELRKEDIRFYNGFLDLFGKMQKIEKQKGE